MHHIAYQLYILSRAVVFPNLSTAALHVKLSQPQLSRIVAAIEKELNLILLDRDAKRKAAWTPAALKLAEAYSKNAKQLSIDVATLSVDATPKHLRIATLDGLTPLACRFAEFLFSKLDIEVIEIDKRDLSSIEEEFLRGTYEFIFSAREPSRKKFSHVRKLGYQSWETIGSEASGTLVLSTYDFNTRRDKGHERHIVVSNSLALRKSWIETIGGIGRFPSEVKQKKNPAQGEEPVLLIGQEHLSSNFWKQVQNFQN